MRSFDTCFDLWSLILQGIAIPISILSWSPIFCFSVLEIFPFLRKRLVLDSTVFAWWDPIFVIWWISTHRSSIKLYVLEVRFHEMIWLNSVIRLQSYITKYIRQVELINETIQRLTRSELFLRLGKFTIFFSDFQRRPVVLCSYDSAYYQHTRLSLQLRKYGKLQD